MEYLVSIILLLLDVSAFGYWTSDDCTMYKGRCYIAYPTVSATFGGATDICSQLPYGVPIIVRSRAEENFTQSLFYPSTVAEYWMGHMTIQNAGGWRWISNETTLYTNWMSGEEDESSSEQCSTTSIGIGVTWRDRSCSFLTAVACESRSNVICDCQTNTAKAAIYHKSSHRIVLAKRFCCCNKTENYGYFEKTPANDNRQHTIMAQIISQSTILCANDCIRRFYCVAFSFDKITRKCILLGSYLKASDQPLDLPTARGYYTCL